MAYVRPGHKRWLTTTLTYAKSKIVPCIQGHERCGHAATKLPTRVVDVGPSGGSREPFLYIPSDQQKPAPYNEDDNPGTDPSWEKFLLDTRRESEGDFLYTTLSYCWGNSQTFVTTLENLEDMKKNIPWHKLPLTIQDAILVTRGLGIRYLWVDALCIIQDSPVDWAAESKKMGDIYGGSFLTISAALGRDVHFGLMSRGGDFDDGLQDYLPVQSDPLFSRAWALQERVSWIPSL
jgi:hypothetical protein